MAGAYTFKLMFYTIPNSTLIVELCKLRYAGKGYKKWLIRYYAKPMGTLLAIEKSVKIRDEAFRNWQQCDALGNILDAK